ncbi:hypothetical protein JYT99_01015 [bacterium AH-315-E09]|nr:hypothetical protein [bacterium AH-315-G05]MBN4074487.1 hypothetical protein [bacterium AH-315-E09]
MTMKKAFFIMTLVFLWGLMVASIIQMPTSGDINNPSYNITTHYYINKTIRDTNAPNIISAIINDYRAFDTLGEATVLFISIIAVSSVMKNTYLKKREEKGDH